VTSRVESGTRKGLVIVAALLCLLLVLAVTVFRSPYLRFLDKDENYYAEFAHACDRILEKHPLGTNGTLLVQIDDPSMPGIIHRLSPSKVTIQTNRVHVMVGVRDFAVVWEPREDYSNAWVLSVIGGPERVVYVEPKL